MHAIGEHEMAKNFCGLLAFSKVQFLFYRLPKQTSDWQSQRLGLKAKAMLLYHNTSTGYGIRYLLKCLKSAYCSSRGDMNNRGVIFVKSGA